MEYNIWLADVVEKIKKKELEVAKRNVGKIPYTSVNGVFDDKTHTSIYWWTNGFWGGLMWQMYHATGEQVYREAAENVEEQLDRCLMNARGMDHDSGFRWLPTAVANYRLHQDPEALNRGVLAADSLAGRFNPVGKYIRAWNTGSSWSERAGWAIIDCMMNLPLLYWAYEELGDPRYLHIATMHADTAMEHFVRGDGSVKHIIEFDPTTGEYIKSQGGQGFGHGTSWTRGQAWAIYGFTLSYIHTKQEKYLDCAKRVANYFIANTPADYLIPVDFRQPEQPRWEDSTAAAIAACGFIEIAQYSEGTDKKIYRDAAINMLMAMSEKRADWSEDVDHILTHCAEAYHHKVDVNTMVYADYFFIEAIWKLSGQELFIW